MRVRASIIDFYRASRVRSRRLFTVAAFLLASCGRAPEAGRGLDATPAAVAAPAVVAAPALAAPVDPAGTRTAFDFIANRVHAVSHRDGRLVVDAGALDFLKYVDGGWKTSWLLGEKDEGKPASLINGVSAMAFLPVDADGDGAGGTAPGPSTLSLTMRALAPAQKVSIFVNEKPAGTIDVAATKKRYDVAVPADLLHAGDNRVRLTFKSAATVPHGDMLTDIHRPPPRSAAAIQQIALGPAALGPVPADLAVVEAREVTVGGVARRALVPGGHGSRISYYVQLPAGAHLAVGVGGDGGGTGGTALVRVAVDGKPARTLYEGPIAARWNDLMLDFGEAAGHAARIDFVARGGAVAWAAPRVAVKAPPHAAPPSPQPRFDHIYVWMVDTFRADKMHGYNPKTRVLTPNYDAFAADATRFAWATVQGTWSLPSHASLLTGVYPTVHKATAHESKLSPTVPFIAEELKHDGYKTGMFSSNGYISSKWGFDRGWDIDRNFIRESLPNSADYLWKTAKAWMTPLLSKRQFVYLATIEPHVAYTPKKEFLVKYWNKPYVGPIKPVQTGVQLGLIKVGKLKINDNDKAYLEALHDAEITGSDALFAGFIADLKKMGLYDRSVVIVVSDHGDQFYEHGSVGHGDTVYQELTHVPMIIRAPGLLPKGAVVNADVEMMDMAPTLLDLAGAKPDPRMQGTTLVPLVFDEVGVSPRAALTVDGQVARGLKVDRYRLVHRGPGRMELYDEFADPREQKDVAADHPIALRGMRGVLGLLHAYETTWSKASWGTAANVAEPFYAAAGPPGHLGAEPKSGGPK
ncbi:MAG TPA: sulfatase [Polyangia bacterium]|nr:sulfatase [Polyangia bacterium]